MEPSRWNFNEENEDLMIAIRRCIAFRCIRWIFVIAGEIFNKYLSGKVLSQMRLFFCYCFGTNDEKNSCDILMMSL